MERNLRSGKHRGEILRQRGLNDQRLAAGGMLQAELKGMQEQSPGLESLFEHAILLKGAIHIITHQRQMPRGGLDSDLMCLSRDEIDLQ
jgi:hypothetical protein